MNNNKVVNLADFRNKSNKPSLEEIDNALNFLSTQLYIGNQAMVALRFQYSHIMSLKKDFDIPQQLELAL